MTKKLHIKTYGCQMNVYDSEKMTEVMSTVGYEASNTWDDADLVILNTCHIREKASEKVYSELGLVRAAKNKKAENGGRMLIAVAGCVGQAEGDEIFRRAPFVDLVVGPQTYHRLPEMVTKVLRGEGREIRLDFPAEEKFDSLPVSASKGGVSAFLTVQEGCDKFCTFCVVPYTRGAEYSRPVAGVLNEAKRLVEAGALEITLLGQNVNAYHGESPDGKTWSLGRLIMELAEIEGLQRIRYTTSHPNDMHDELFEAHAKVEKLMPFLHLPVQSGSDNILAKMNRKHKVDDYRRVIEKLRNARTDIAFSSDFIVGFPGESDRDFEDTMSLVREVSYAQAYSFKYSERPGTPAAAVDKQIHEDVKSERLQALQELLVSQQVSFNEQCVGKVMPVLFERQGKHEGQILGKSPYMQSVHIKNGTGYMGKITDIKMIVAYQNSLAGEVAGDMHQKAAA